MTNPTNIPTHPTGFAPPRSIRSESPSDPATPLDKIAGLELTGRSFKAVYPQLVEFYNQALLVEEVETLVIS